MTLCLGHTAAAQRRLPSEDALGRWNPRRMTRHERCNKIAELRNLAGRPASPGQRVSASATAPHAHQSTSAIHITCGILEESNRPDCVWGIGSLDKATIMTAAGWHTQQRLTPLQDRIRASRASAIQGMSRGCRRSFASSASSRLQNDSRKRSDACK